MKPLKNDRLIRALLRQPVDTTPVWIMRQAGRYLPEYRAIRQKCPDFMTLCKTPELASEVTLQPILRFDLDAAIIFSDILTIPDAMGLGLSFVEGEGPRFAKPLRTAKDIEAIREPDVANALSYVFDAIKLTKMHLANRLPLIGFAGSPWTLATYMIEGGSSKNFALIKQMMFTQPEVLKHLLMVLAQTIAKYLNLQIAAGADVVMLFDTWGGILTPRDYENFSLHYMRLIIEQLTRERDGQRIPIILFTKNSGLWLEMMATSGCDALGIDWTIDIAEARMRIGNQVALQGNMDPAMLYATPERIREEVAIILNRFGAGSGHVFNLGHGIHPDVPPKNVAALVDAVHDLSAKTH